MENKKLLYGGIAAIVIAVVLMLSIKTEEIGERVTDERGTTTDPYVELPEPIEGQNEEYAIVFDEIEAETYFNKQKGIFRIVHQKTKNGQSYDYLIQYLQSELGGWGQAGRVFLGKNVTVTAINIVEGERLGNGFVVEVVMNDRTLAVKLDDNGWLDQTDIRIK